MAKFQSSSFSVNVDQKTLMAFLSVPANLLEILPADRIEDWKSEGETCSFKIKGLAGISLRLSKGDDNSVVYVSNADKPFQFTLKVQIADKETGSEVDAVFDADVNAFMGAMLKSPLTNFLNGLGQSIKDKFL